MANFSGISLTTLHTSERSYIYPDMRYLVFLSLVMGSLHAQCNMCDINSAPAGAFPTPYGFNPATLVLPSGKDTTVVIYFAFPDGIQSGGFTLYPNYAIWVDSLRLDIGLLTLQNGQPFAYNSSNPVAGGIHFDQMHRYKQYDPSDPNRKANFVVYQNPGGTPGQSPPIGCMRLCVRTSSTGGVDTLRLKVRAFISGLGDGPGKDTTSLIPMLFSSNAWLDTTFRYTIEVQSPPPPPPPPSVCVPNISQSPMPYGFNPDPLILYTGRNTTFTVYFTFSDSIRQGNITLYPNYAIWVDSLRLDRGLITLQNGLPFSYNPTNPALGGVQFDQMHRYKQYDPNDPNRKANFVVYQNPGGTPGQSPPIGCMQLSVRTSSMVGIDTLRLKVRIFISALGDGLNKDTTSLIPRLFGSNTWLDTTFRYTIVVMSPPPPCSACMSSSGQTPVPYGFNPDPLILPPSRDTSLTVHFALPDAMVIGSITIYPNYAIWVDDLRLDIGLLTLQNGQPFAYYSADPAQGGIRFDQMHRYKQYDPNDPNRKANFVVYQNPGGTPGQSPPIGCMRLCVRTSSTGGVDTLRLKVRAFISGLGDGPNKDTTSLIPMFLGSNAWIDTTFRYTIIVTTVSTALEKSSGAVQAFSVSPNPAIYEAVARFSLVQPTALVLRAVAVDGREVYRHAGSYAAGVHTHSLSLPAGIYTLLLETPAGSVRQKLVVVE